MRTVRLSKTLRDYELRCVAEYIVDCESGEYDSYVSFCAENNLEPSEITKTANLGHVYAKALVGLGMIFPND